MNNSIELCVFIEINGVQTQAGTISGSTAADARFSYDENYIESRLPAISISLPVKDEKFTPEQTRNFFEGLLPEGFARKSVAEWIHATEDDYLPILQALGSECLGAIRISSDAKELHSYRKLGIDEVRSLAREGVTKSTELVTEAHLSLTGASGKVGLYYDEPNGTWYEPIGQAASTHIVKQSHIRHQGIVTNEQLALQTAATLGIEIPESFIINMGDAQDDEVLFATKRYDRQINNESQLVDGLPSPLRLHQEDFAQALGIASSDKYERNDERYLPKMFNVLRSFSAEPITDQLKLWDIIVFDYLIGNTDNHIKNLSLVYSSDLKRVRLAPAYDIISTAIYQGTSREMAIGIGGERNIDLIGRQHFADAAIDAGLNPKMAMKRFDRLATDFEKALEETATRLSEQGYSNANDIQNRILKNRP